MTATDARNFLIKTLDSADMIELEVLHHRRHDARTFTLDVKTAVPASGVTAICGPSGAGKTTLLRCISGLEPKAKLTIHSAGDQWPDVTQARKPNQRQIGYVFQQPLLFPHLNVRGNLQYAEKRRAPVKGNMPALFKFESVTDLLGIRHILDQKPESLSGGEKQRAAIARALLCCPKMLLMDEPLASLDDARKAEFLPYLEQLHDELSLPILYVSHSMREVARLADHILLLENGSLVHSSSASKAFNEHGLLQSLEDEQGVILDAVVTQRDPKWHLICAAFSGGKIWLNDSGEKIGHKIRLSILAKDISLMTSEPKDTSVQNQIPCRISAISSETPATSLITLRSKNIDLIARVTNRAIHALSLDIGTEVYALIKAVAVIR